MRKEGFFKLLMMARILKQAGRTKIERWTRLTWFRQGYFYGGFDEKYRTKS